MNVSTTISPNHLVRFAPVSSSSALSVMMRRLPSTYTHNRVKMKKKTTLKMEGKKNEMMMVVGGKRVR
uniref:Ovule protein n=1 Tax=Caenorhabditis tropicalis TaxID=1561998 RepID=A0A1I7UL54_9PELO